MNIKYYFFGKELVIDQKLADRQDVTLKLDLQGLKHDNLLLLNQIHGKEVVVIDEIKKIYGNQNLPKADAIVTNLTNVAIGVITADCAPILFMDKEKNIIAATHAGWNGARLGVVQAGVEAMKNLGAKNIKAIIGPMIQQKSYEVSKEFFANFLSENSANEIFFKNGVKPDKFWFDLPSYVEKKLSEAGVEQIENLQIDTYENEEKFFSFRRSTHRKEADCGRNISIIVIN